MNYIIGIVNGTAFPYQEKYLMDKRLSIDTLQQQLAKTENLREAQLNRLLERLESQKAKLPLEDHSIIDWGINAIRIRMRQRDQLMDEVQAKLNSKCMILVKRWERDCDPEKMYESFIQDLPGIVDAGSGLDYKEATKIAISNLKRELKKRPVKDKNSLDNILQLSSKFCSSKAEGIEDNLKNKKIRESLVPQALKLAKHYRLAARDLWSPQPSKH